MVKNENLRRKAILKKLQKDMEKDRANPQKVSKWLKLVETKKRLFSLEYEMDKLTKQLQKRT
ncbi:MAG: hypothetical protein HQ572_05330 [Candidatus Omnitrophica bacterium]|nr:hypothetical protein [Candidatus Omnitrophota bacterium]